MTVSSTLNRVTYTGNGSSTAFAVSFPFQAQADLIVVETIIATGVQTTKALTTHYTISGTTDDLGYYPNGGTVTAVTAPASTVTWTIYRDPSATQTLNLSENNALPAESLEAQLDYLTMLVQRLKDRVDRSMRQPEGDSANIDLVPAKVDRASKYLAFDADGDPIATAGTTSAYVVTPFMETVLDDTTAAAARATLGFPTVSGATTGHALVVNPAASGGMSWNHRAQPNPIINGNMEIWQRGTSGFTGTGNGYTADRWRYVSGSAAAAVAISRSTNVPTVAQAGVLFNYALEVDITTADAALAAGEYAVLEQVIEGYNWRNFAQREFTLSFWISATKTGLHAVGFRNSGNDRGYIGTYTVNSADTWEYKTVTVSASPSAGTWDYTNGTGLTVSFGLGAGANHQYTAASWQVISSGPYGTASTVNDMDSTANYFRITGVKMEPGSVATPIQFVPFEEELARAQRYYEKSYALATAPGTGALNAGDSRHVAINVTDFYDYGIQEFKVRKRTSPSVTLYNPSTGTAIQFWNYSAAATQGNAAVQAVSEARMQIFCSNTALTAGHVSGVHWTADAEL